MSAVATEPVITGWRTTPLKAEVTLKNGKAYNAKDWKKDGYPIIRIQNLKNPLAEFNYFQGDPETQIPIRDGDLVFSWSGSKGTSFGPHIWRGELGVLNQHIFKVILNPDSQLGQDFLYFALRFLTVEIEDKAYGLAALVHVRKGDFEATPIPLPPLPEQKKIAHILSTIQRAIESQERIIQTTTELKKTLMHKLFTEGLRNEPQKQTEIGPVPESWEVVEIGDVFKFTSGKTKPKDTSRESTDEKTIPVYGGNGVLGYSAESLLDEEVLILGRVGEYCGCAHLTAPISWVTDNALYAKEEKRSVKRTYVRTHFEHLNLNQYSNKMGQPLITQGVINRVKFGLPSREEQDELANVFETLDARLNQIRAKRSQLQDLFRTLLHELMTAKTRVH